MYPAAGAFLIGMLFGIGLVIANMINPTKILNFLDITGYWDPSLLLVMLAAIVITCPGYYWIKKLKKPLLGNKFHYPPVYTIDKKLIIGSAIFGIGWGMTGFCPGPAIAVLGTGQFAVIYFIGSMVLGSVFCFWFDKFTNKDKL